MPYSYEVEESLSQTQLYSVYPVSLHVQNLCLGNIAYNVLEIDQL